MNASEIMTTTVITAGPDDKVTSAVEKMLEHRVSALPVVDGEGKVVGIVSEGDLIKRVESESTRSRSWWLELLTGPAESAREFLKTHGTRVSDIMTGHVISVTEDESVSEIARKLEKHRIKRVPVMREGILVGVVSRANILRSVAATNIAPPTRDDAATREEIVSLLEEAGLMSHLVSVTVTDDTVHLWGSVSTDEQVAAARAAAESVAPDVRIENHLTVVPYYIGYL